MEKVKDIKVRIEKLNWGSLWALRRTYIKNGKFLGNVTKNPHTDKYEVLKAYFEKDGGYYLPQEFSKFAEARDFILNRTDWNIINKIDY